MNLIVYKIKALVKFLIVLSALWILGLIAYYKQIPEAQLDTITHKDVDAYIILTGGKYRIEEGIKLFAASDSKLLLISGMESDAAIENIKSKIKQDKIDLRDKTIIYGKIADSTISNALESDLFINLHKVKSCVVITSNYHIPRVKYVFSELVHGAECCYHPIFSNKFIKSGDFTTIQSFMLIIKEYNKFLGSVIVINFEKMETFWDSSTKSIAYFLKSI